MRPQNGGAHNDGLRLHPERRILEGRIEIVEGPDDRITRAREQIATGRAGGFVGMTTRVDPRGAEGHGRAREHMMGHRAIQSQARAR